VSPDVSDASQALAETRAIKLNFCPCPTCAASRYPFFARVCPRCYAALWCDAEDCEHCGARDIMLCNCPHGEPGHRRGDERTPPRWAPVEMRDW